MFRMWRCALSFRYVPKVDPTSRRQSWPPCDSITAWLCETSQSCRREIAHLRDRPMRPPLKPTVKMRSVYGPLMARRQPHDGASDTVPMTTGQPAGQARRAPRSDVAAREVGRHHGRRGLRALQFHKVKQVRRKR